MTPPPTDRRNAAIAALKKQIAEQRARLDPDVLKRAAQAAELSQKTPEERAAGLVPYDRAAAAEAIRLFLQNHPDAAHFEEELMSLLRQQQQ